MKVPLIFHQFTVPLSLAMLTAKAGPVLSVFKFDIGHSRHRLTSDKFNKLPNILCLSISSKLISLLDFKTVTLLRICNRSS